MSLFPSISIEKIYKAGFLLLIPMFLLPIPLRWDIHVLLVMAFGVTCYLVLSIYSPEAFQLKLDVKDYIWYGFTAIGALSYLWAINTSLVLPHVFGWLTLITFSVVLKSIIADTTYLLLLQKLFHIVLILSAIYIAVVLFIQFSFSSFQWSTWFGYNENVTTLNYILLLPYFLFTRSKKSFLRILIFLLCIIGVTMLIIASSIGVVVSIAAAVFLHLIISQYHIRPYKLLAGGLSLLIAISIFSFHLNFLDTASFISRMLMIETSFDIFRQAPLLGIGLGNWEMLAFKYGVPSDALFNPDTVVFDIKNHNLYTTLLVELGLIGCSIYIIPFALIIYNKIKTYSLLTKVECAALYGLIIYLVASMFYKTNHLDNFFFSRAEFIAFCSYSILLIPPKKK